MKVLIALLKPDWWVEQLKSVSGWMLAAAAVLLLGGGMVLAAFIGRKEVAVAVVFASTLIGTSILSLVLPKLLANVIDDERIKNQLLEEKLKAETAARLAQEKLRESEREVARLERMELSLAAIEPVAKLSLLSVEMILKDFRTRKLGSKQTPTFLGIPIGRIRQSSYVGVIEIPVKAHLGVDLHKVQIREDVSGTLILGGLKMSTIGEVGHADSPLEEVRTELLRDDEVVEVVIDPNDSRLRAERREHEKQLRGRIAAGQEFTVFEKPLLQAAREVLKSLLAPMRRNIVFEDEPAEGSKPLLAFLEGEKQKLAKQVADTHRELGANQPVQSPCDSLCRTA